MHDTTEARLGEAVFVEVTRAAIDRWDDDERCGLILMFLDRFRETRNAEYLRLVADLASAWRESLSGN